MKKHISFVIPAACAAMLFALYCSDYDFHLTPKDFEQWSDWTLTPATCVAGGDSTRTCTGRGCPVASEKRSIPKLTTHTLIDNWVVTTPATCVATGQSTRTCTVSGCTHSEDKEIPELGHTWDDNWVITTPATCLAAGDSTRTCTVVGCSHSETKTISQQSVCDPVVYGDETYQTVKIGDQIWMAKNLNYAGIGNTIGVCYNMSGIYCSNYGRLYTWAEAMDISLPFNQTLWTGSEAKHRGICPEGWHLPSRDEWDVLAAAVGGEYRTYSENLIYWEYAGAKLKSATGWDSGGNGTDNYGFSALPGGGTRYDEDDSMFYFQNAGDHGYWWTTTQWDATTALVRAMVHGNKIVSTDVVLANSLTSSVLFGADKKNLMFSVRCVKDD